MNPIGATPCFCAARSSRSRARSRAASSSKTTWLNRDSAFRTCGGVVDRQPALAGRVDVRERAVGELRACLRIELGHAPMMA